LDIGRDQERAPNLQIALYGDDAGHPSLNPLMFVEPSPTLTTQQRQSLTFLFQNEAVLQPDVLYWLVLQPSTLNVAHDAKDALYSISTSLVTPYPTMAQRDFNSSAGAWGDWVLYPNTPAPVFRLDGVAVPEPAAWALFGLGGALAVWAGRRRGRFVGRHDRRKPRGSDSPVS
jgi:hypothetical protein